MPLSKTKDLGQCLNARVKLAVLALHAGVQAAQQIASLVNLSRSALRYTDQGTVLLVVYGAFGESVVEGLWHKTPVGSLLAAAGVIEGRTCSAYPACGPEVRLAGGTYADIPVDQAHTDGNLVTAPAWPAHPAWLAQFLAVLGTRISL